MTKSSNIYDSIRLLAENDKMPHALAVEDSNTEKALEEILFLVKLMLCNGDGKRPCGKCGNCVKVDSGSHTDVKIIKPEKDLPKIGVDNIREIKEDAYILSIEGNYKFYIIKDADLMTAQAQNAFIKILEEPPQNIKFILILKKTIQ